MKIVYEELHRSRTELGELLLRRRTEPKVGREVLEVKLDDQFLMSSLFTTGETALANLGLARLGHEEVDVIVGGLGLGYTAAAVLAHSNVRSLVVIEALQPVIDWHRDGLLPLGPVLCADARAELVHGDFFSFAMSGSIDPRRAGRRVHAILLDIDHSPRQPIAASASRWFYEPDGLRAMSSHLHPGGVFAMWSDEPPDASFMANLEAVFNDCEARIVEFDNPLLGTTAACTIYLASLLA